MRRSILFLLSLGLSVTCSKLGGGDGDGDADDGSPSGNDFVPGEPSRECRSARLTSYDASGEQSGCGFLRTHEFLPEFVRVERLTAAMAEPWIGGSYNGDPWEACGECWEVSTTFNTRIIMIDNLCPNAGNPPCEGPQFHLDLSQEARIELGAAGYDAASARPVACPVTGNVHAYITDRNEWGYLQFSLANHTVPIRNVEYQPVGSNEWVAMERVAASWHDPNHGDHGSVFDPAGPGATFRLTTAQGQVVESPIVLGYELQIGDTFDLGIQVDDIEGDEGGSCDVPFPSDIYIDGWGEYATVYWQVYPWGGANLVETSEGCHQGDGCLRADGFAGGFSLAYHPPFAVTDYRTLSLWAKSASGSGRLWVAPSNDGNHCEGVTVDVGSEWAEITIDIASNCPNHDMLWGLAAQLRDASYDLMLDDIRLLE